MINYKEYPHHPKVQKLIDILQLRIQNNDSSMFTIMACYHLTKMASMMRCTVNANGYGVLPVNFYGMSFGTSGSGKGHAMSILEGKVTNLFLEAFKEQTRPYIVNKRLEDLAIAKAAKNGTDIQDEFEQLQSEFKKSGEFYTSFDSGTTPAVKEYRHQLLLTELGSINFEIDELGDNLLASKDITTVFLELWDGEVKGKLVKNTVDNKRTAQIVGKTPTNLLGFGTPTAIFDGGVTERLMMHLLTSGYARRTFFGFSDNDIPTELSAEQRLAQLMDTTSDKELLLMAQEFEQLADPLMHKFEVTVPEDVMLEIVMYEIACMERATKFRKTDDLRRSEMRGRHFKSIKFAAALAFIDGSDDMTSDQWRAAVRVAEESGEAFDKMISQDPPHARVAKFLADHADPITIADIMQELPFFPKAANAQRDIIKLATSWGHTNNIVIKRRVQEEIETLQGEALTETTLDKIICSHSTHQAYYYLNVTGTWDELKQLVKLPGQGEDPGRHWCVHHFLDGHRSLATTVQGFNMLVLDIDGTCPLDKAKSYLENYQYIIYTTKSHTEDVHRYRIVIPMTHILKLSPDEYKEFMGNVLEHLPFEVDSCTKDASRKWLSNEHAEVYVNEGKFFNVLPFIPRTKKNDERRKNNNITSDMGGLERFFLAEIVEGNRNHTLAKYAFALVDAGYDPDAISNKVKALNKLLESPLEDQELEETVIASATTKYLTRG